MNPVTVLLGALALVFGLYTLVARVKTPEKLGKLEAMKKQWGPSAGNAVHLVAYTIVPIIVGLVFIITGFRGVALF